LIVVEILGKIIQTRGVGVQPAVFDDRRATLRNPRLANQNQRPDDEYVNLKHVQMKIVSAMFACHMASVLGLTHEPQIISGSKAGHVSGGLIAGYRYYSPRA